MENKTKTIFFISIIIIIFYYYKYVNRQVDYMLSDIDNRTYMVRDFEDKQYAANFLARIRKNIFILTNHLYENKEKYPEFKKNIEKLYKSIQDVEISEGGDEEGFTSYTVNKGEQIIFCLRSKKDNDKLHDFNLLMYVVLHEIGHCCSFTQNHTEEFKKNFHFITGEGIKLGIYEKIDFEKQPKEYCGIMVTDSII